MRGIYDDGKNEELHFGNYSAKIPAPIGDGTILDVNSTRYTDESIENGTAIIFDRITDPSDINEIIYRANYYMKSAIEYTEEEAVRRLRPDVVDRFGADSLDAIYMNKGYFSSYNLFEKLDCLSFVQKILGDSSVKTQNIHRIDLEWKK